VGPRAGLNDVKRKIFRLPEIEPRPSSPSLYRLSYPIPFTYTYRRIIIITIIIIIIIIVIVSDSIFCEVRIYFRIVDNARWKDIHTGRQVALSRYKERNILPLAFTQKNTMARGRRFNKLRHCIACIGPCDINSGFDFRFVLDSTAVITCLPMALAVLSVGRTP
jgi:hypothetical protein